jgi:toxin YoeB
MNLVFTPEAWEDYVSWHSTDPRRLKRINQLLKEIAREPFGGIGKPEPLQHAFQGCWSRRIDGEHRVVYKVSGENVWLLQLRYHYRD